MSDYYIGQRVISKNEIVVVCHPPAGYTSNTEKVWIMTPQGYPQWRAASNVQPLPNGQL